MSDVQAAAVGDSSKSQALTNGSETLDANKKIVTESKKRQKQTELRKTSKTNVNRGMMQKSPEDLQEEIFELKKSMASLAEENTSLKAKTRRVEEDNMRKNEELKRALSDKKSSSANVVVNNLKQKVFKLEQTLKEKDGALKKLESDSQASKVHEMKLQIDAYYREIIRLKNLNNLRETARTTNEDSIQQILIANKELEEENQILHNDLERALAINKAQPQHTDYMNMSKVQLVGIIMDIENKMNLISTAGQAVVDTADMTIDGMKLQLCNLKCDKQQLSNEVQKVKEDRLRYRDLAESRDQELKALRLLIEHMQKQMERKPSSSGSGSRKASTTAKPRQPLSAVAPSQPARPNGALGTTVFDRLAQSPRSAQDAAKQTGTAAEKSAAARPKSSKTLVGRRLSPKVPKSVPAAAAAAPLQAKKPAAGSKPASPRTKPATPTSPLNKPTTSPRTKPASASLRSIQRETTGKTQTRDASARKVNLAAKGKTSTVAKKGKTTTTTTTVSKISPEKKQAQEVCASVSATTFVLSAEDLQVKGETVEQVLTVEKIPDELAGGQSPANKSVTYTVLKTLDIRSEVVPEAAGNTKPKAQTKKSVGSQMLPRTNQKQIDNFSQNVAAKKIQKMWKHHQVEVHQVHQRRRVHDFQQNRAARTIQRGWKKHSQKVYRNPGDLVNGEPELLLDFSSALAENPFPISSGLNPSAAEFTPPTPQPNHLNFDSRGDSETF